MPTARAHRQPPLGKLSPPRLGRVFGRERLFARLDATAAAPGLWVAGPPGIGKTTLVATYLDARALPCLWLQLDAGDADPATFVHFLRAAAARAVPRRPLRLPAPGADDLRDLPAFIRRCFRRLAAVLDLPWVLVLDNVQELGQAPALHAGIAAALTELPQRVRVIAISRDPPPPDYARALANQQLAVLDEQAGDVLERRVGMGDHDVGGHQVANVHRDPRRCGETVIVACAATESVGPNGPARTANGPGASGL